MSVSVRLQLMVLGVCLFFCPPLFTHLARRWFPDEYDGDNRASHLKNSQLMRRRFWSGFLYVILVIVLVILLRWWWLGRVPLASTKDWLQVAAVGLALLAALGRGGWEIQSWKGETVIERIDRGMYLIEQLGTAALLILILTL